MTAATLTLDDIDVDVIYKAIKNVHLSVHPPTGRVRISAPLDANPEVVRAFAISRLTWIRRQQAALAEQVREPPREFLERESHYLWGKRYLLSIEENHGAPDITLGHQRITLNARAGMDEAHKNAVVAHWYRSKIREVAPEMITKWEPVLGVKLNRFYVRQMKTMWGSCTPSARSIRLNTELAKKPQECLEYIIVHELAHLREPSHNSRFVAIMNDALPHWRARRAQLNDLPIRHEKWRY